jgi:hypothetical protein
MGLEKGDAHWIETWACALNSMVIINIFSFKQKSKRKCECETITQNLQKRS